MSYPMPIDLVWRLFAIRAFYLLLGSQPEYIVYVLCSKIKGVAVVVLSGFREDFIARKVSHQH